MKKLNRITSNFANLSLKYFLPNVLILLYDAVIILCILHINISDSEKMYTLQTNSNIFFKQK